VKSLKNKANELLSHLYPDLPHITCLTEHHMNITEIKFLNLENYNVGAQFCRIANGKGGAIMYIHNSLKFTTMELDKYSKEKDIDVCGVKLKVNSLKVYIITVYRSPAGNFNNFLQTLDKVLKSLCTIDSRIIICGDININFLIDNEQKRKLENMLLMYNPTGIVNFPTRINGTSSTAIDNIFFDTSCFEEYTVCPLIDDLSDQDGQIVRIKAIFQTQSDKKYIVRKINKDTISDFLNKLRSESWEGIFNNDDINIMFNSFLNTYLKTFYSSSPPR